jgi:hypothetical protein
MRSEVKQFIGVWNSHRIRNQKHRPTSVKGCPFILYESPEINGHEDFKIETVPGMVQDLKAFHELDQWGKCLIISYIDQNIARYSPELQYLNTSCCPGEQQMDAYIWWMADECFSLYL